MNGLTLYNLQGRMFELMAKAESEELTPDEVQEQYNEICTALQQKSTGLIGYYRNMECGIEALDGEIKRLMEMKQRAIKARDSYKEYIKSAMDNMNIVEISTDIGKLKIAKNPASVEILNVDEVPDEFKNTKTIVETTVDKTSIKNHFKDTGELIPGCTVVTNKTRLDIK